MSKNFKWESVTAISSLVVALTALLAVGFTIRQIKDFQGATKIQRLVEESREFDSTKFLTVRKALASSRLDATGKLKPLDPTDPPIEIYSVLNYFDYLGLLHKRGYLDAEDIWDVFGYWMLNFYVDSLPVIRREQKDSPNTYKNFEALVVVLRKIDQSHGEPTGDPSPQDLADFYAYELNQPTGMPAQSQTQTKTGRQKR